MRIQPLRGPRQASPQCLEQYIAFRHPNYIESQNVMILLPPLDIATEDDETDAETLAPTMNSPSQAHKTACGIHHGTALVACQIIAVNAFERSYLSYDRAGKERVAVPTDGLLTRSDYYLQVSPSLTPDSEFAAGEASASEGNREPWAVTPNFEHWRFPHKRLPEPWASMPRSVSGVRGALSAHPTSSSLTESVERPRQQEQQQQQQLPASRCIITAAGPSTVDDAHIIPRMLRNWFDNNTMLVYANNDIKCLVIDAKDNQIRLRSDLHKDFNSRAFAIVPKPVRVAATASVSGSSRHAFAVHFFSTSRQFRDSTTKFHNQLVHDSGDDGPPPEYLFARFAHTVFGLAKGFVLQGSSRRIALVEQGAEDWVIKTHDWDQARRNDLFGGGGSRSSSPRKRSRDTESSQQMTSLRSVGNPGWSGDDEQHQDDDDDALPGALGYQSGDEEVQRRGRTRRRSGSVSSLFGDMGQERKAKRRCTLQGQSQQAAFTSADHAC